MPMGDEPDEDMEPPSVGDGMSLPGLAAEPPRMGKKALRATPREAAAALVRDVAWRPYLGMGELLASAAGCDVWIWAQDGRDPEGCWRPRQRIPLGEDVWRVSWAPAGNVIIASVGSSKEHRAV
eukprot:CAMPEP_0176159290 /NCGR_PEP_ID=MMETSP0120_2-20121206/81484_1 /TAXON_ID=160619 /ORGANISM="Kryptoperidinium foliaceum, Strain CCMP 1326" /LENGTH=123 /DNA_ID=CAMNT_0017496701 /DNA_START=33 /DNA_END=401 /DNA_ORIENTATION=-